MNKISNETIFICLNKCECGFDFDKLNWRLKVESREKASIYCPECGKEYLWNCLVHDGVIGKIEIIPANSISHMDVVFRL